MKRTICIAALLCVILGAAGCTNISDKKVKDNTVSEVKVTGESAADETAEDDTAADDELLSIVRTESSGTSYTEPESVFTDAPSGNGGTTTFPTQTAPEEILSINFETGEPETSKLTRPATAEPVITEPVTTTTTAAPATTAADTTTPADTTTAASVTASADQTINYNVIGENGILVSYQNGHYRGIMACFGTYGLCEKWANAVNTFAKKLPDANVYSLTVPVASEFYTPKKFWDSGFTVSQLNKINHIKENLKGAVNVEAYDILKDHIDEPIYSRTDHHWTPLGAYYAAKTFAETAGVDFPRLKEYEKVSRSGYVGSMYTYSKDYHLYNDAETFTMYISPNADKIKTTYYNTYFGGAYTGDLFVTRNASAYYCSFIGSDNRITKVETNVKNGRTLVVFKQSYGNALIPFLTSSFEKIYVCDMRYFELNGIQFCKDVGATDVLCTDCVMIAAGNGGKYLEYLINR